jgi:4-amino-4-deoxy-L-arabinose transferase-like glycosyltransferase
MAIAQTTTMINGKHRGFLAILAVLVVLHLGKAAAFIAAGQGPLQGDSFVYWSLGERIVAGDWRLLDDPPEVARTPGYLYFVAFFQATCGRWALTAAIFAHHLLLLGAVALAAWTCWRLTGKRSSVVLCLVLALACFSCWGVAVNLLSDTLLLFLLALSVALAVAWRHSPSHWKSVALGLALGAAVLTKPVAQFAGLIAIGWMLLDRTNQLSWRRRAIDCALVLAAALAIVTPWLVRNEARFGQPFLARVAGRSLWWSCFKGNPADTLDPPIPFADGPATRAIRQTAAKVNLHDTWRISKELVRQGYPEIDADALMLQGAKEAIRANPWKFLLSRWRRYVGFWITPSETFRPNTRSFRFSGDRPKREYETELPIAEIQGQATWKASWYFQQGWLNVLWHPELWVYALATLACAAAIVFLVQKPGMRGVAVFFGLWLGYFSTVTTLFGCPVYRYRMILEPAMIVLVVCGWEALRDLWAAKRSVNTLSRGAP